MAFFHAPPRFSGGSIIGICAAFFLSVRIMDLAPAPPQVGHRKRRNITSCFINQKGGYDTTEAAVKPFVCADGHAPESQRLPVLVRNFVELHRPGAYVCRAVFYF